jgi:hypothetical protein
MTPAAPRSIDAYLKQLRAALADQDPSLIQDAAYDAEEYLRAEIAAHPDKSEADVLELIASTYGAPDEVAAAYRETEAKVKAALHTPAPPAVQSPSPLQGFFSVYRDPRAYTSVFFHAVVTGDRHRVLRHRRDRDLAVARPCRPRHRDSVFLSLRRRGARDLIG